LGPEATEAKKKLAESILAKLRPLGFDQVCWRGDGGLFAAREAGTGERVVEAARALFEVFLEWQRKTDSKLSVSELALRISCHSCSVFIDKEPDYWSSPGLNDFCKYERYLSHENTISITGEVFALGTGKYRGVFEGRRHEIEIPNTSVKWVAYYDQAPTTQASAKSQTEMTTSFFKGKFDAQTSSDVTAETRRFVIGDAIVLGMASSPEETLDIELEKVDCPGFGPLERRYPQWAGEQKKILDEINEKHHPGSKDWEKGSPLLLRPPLIDFPLAKISYCTVPYSKARSFFTILEKNNSLWTELARAGADYGRGESQRPGILVAHMVVLAVGPDKKPCVVLAQRSTRQKSNMTFEGGRWSASIEEQFTPSDETLDWTITRGLKEELLGPYAEVAKKHVAALFLERRILNLAVAVVCRTGMSIKEIHDVWLDCKDHDEHSQIVGLPIEYPLIRECVTNGHLSKDAQSRCHVLDNGIWSQPNNWELHKTSPFRLALAYWASQIA
jgi:hypothetical protein